MNKLSVIISFVLLAAASPAYSHERSDADWSDRGVFVFGSFPIDLEIGYLRFPHQNVRVEDCSDARSFCLKSATLNVALPRKCMFWDSESVFEANGIVVRTIDRADGQLGGQLAFSRVPAEVRLLAVDGDDSNLFLYQSGRGVLAIFRWYNSAVSEGSLVNSLQSDPIGMLMELQRANKVARYDLVTFDPLGPCSK